MLQESAPFVVPQRLYVHPGEGGQFTATHVAIVNPVPGYGVKSSLVGGNSSEVGCALFRYLSISKHVESRWGGGRRLLLAARP